MGTITNKYVMAGLSLLGALIGAALKFDWVSLSNARNAGLIVALLMGLKTVLDMLLPAPGQTVVSTGRSLLFTHRVKDK